MEHWAFHWACDRHVDRFRVVHQGAVPLWFCDIGGSFRDERLLHTRDQAGQRRVGGSYVPQDDGGLRQQAVLDAVCHDRGSLVLHLPVDVSPYNLHDRGLGLLAEHGGSAVLGERGHGGLAPALGHFQDGEIQAFRCHAIWTACGCTRLLVLVLRWRSPRGARVHRCHDFGRDILHVHRGSNNRGHVAWGRG